MKKMVICCKANKFGIENSNCKHIACDMCTHSSPHEKYTLLNGETCTKWGICDLTGDGSNLIKVRCEGVKNEILP